MKDTMQFNTYCGTVAILGRPNSGKSTLLNQLIGEKVSIVTPKPQTTRMRVTGILTKNNVQYVFVDTPGLHESTSKYGDMMVKSIFTTSDDCDVAVLVAEADRHPGKPEKQLIERLSSLNVPIFLALNKVDICRKDVILEVIEKYNALAEFRAILPLSAKTGLGCDDLLNEIKAVLPESEFAYPEDALTNLSQRFLAAEIVREKLMLKTEKEVPHGITCETERFEVQDNGMIDIDVVIVCEKPNHKSIIIGKQGSMLKSVGTEARADIEQMLEAKVFLKLWVKVKADWKNSPAFLTEMVRNDPLEN